MKRYRQTLDELLSLLSPVNTTWMDEHSADVVAAITSLPVRNDYRRDDISRLLADNFEVGITFVRLVLGMSKDEFHLRIKTHLKGSGGFGVSRFTRNTQEYLDALDKMGIRETLSQLVNRPVDWKDLLTERLRYGRGSAIKGQKRGRGLEDTTEALVTSVFGKNGFESRCRFIGADGQATEKADFAIPSKSDPRILIECKAYGATGSKQTDVLGDIERIVLQKRSDTHLLLVTDGDSWKLRINDLRKLVDWQNTGKITRIYTQLMSTDFEEDLRTLKQDHAF